MDKRPGTRPMSFERAIADPAAVFSSPQEVLDDLRLTRTQKLEVLRRWAYDADRLAVAETEGMGGGEPSLQGRVLDALNQLEREMFGTSSPAQHSPPGPS
ncbi:MAG TPA: hypothetical protein VK843_04860 [Planctomycetota bacterium]|nr:hypothetical protein [Planctomycetota bacterium]